MGALWTDSVDPKSVYCPWCGAFPTYSCILLQPGGHRKEVTYFHHARVKVASERNKK